MKIHQSPIVIDDQLSHDFTNSGYNLVYTRVKDDHTIYVTRSFSPSFPLDLIVSPIKSLFTVQLFYLDESYYVYYQTIKSTKLKPISEILREKTHLKRIKKTLGRRSSILSKISTIVFSTIVHCRIFYIPTTR